MDSKDAIAPEQPVTAVASGEANGNSEPHQPYPSGGNQTESKDEGVAPQQQQMTTSSDASEANGNTPQPSAPEEKGKKNRVYGKIIIVSAEEVRKRKRQEQKEARREAKRAKKDKDTAESSSSASDSTSSEEKNGETDEAESTSMVSKKGSIIPTIKCHYDGCGAMVKVYRDANPACAVRKAQMRHVQSSHIHTAIKCHIEGCATSCQHLTALYSHISAAHGGVGKLTEEQRETYLGVKKSVVDKARNVINECFPKKGRPGKATDKAEAEPPPPQAKPDPRAIKCLHAGCGEVLKVKRELDTPSVIRKAQIRHLQAKHLTHIPVKCPIDGCVSQCGHLGSLGSHISLSHGGVTKLTTEHKKLYDQVKKQVMDATKKLSVSCFPKPKGARGRGGSATGRVVTCRYPDCGGEVRANRRGKIGEAKKRHIQRVHLTTPAIQCPVDDCHRVARYSELAHIANHISHIHGGIGKLSAEQAAFHETNKTAVKKATNELLLECFPYRMVARKVCAPSSASTSRLDDISVDDISVDDEKNTSVTADEKDDNAAEDAALDGGESTSETQ